MKSKFEIHSCPTCGSDKIQRAVRDITRQYKGQTYTVPSVELYICPNSQEKVYDQEAISKIESYAPAYRKKRVLVETET